MQPLDRDNLLSLEKVKAEAKKSLKAGNKAKAIVGVLVSSVQAVGKENQVNVK